MPDNTGLEPYLFASAGDSSVLFKGPVLSELRTLEYDLARSALKHGGLRPRSMESLIVQACGRSRAEGADTAIVWLEEQLDQPPRNLRVIVPCPAFVGNIDVDIGSCRIVHALPNEFAESNFPPPEWLTTPVLVTEVVSHDEESARLIAADRFDEALAILNLGDASPSQLSPRSAIIGENGSTGWNSGSGDRIYAERIVNPPDPSDPPGYPPLLLEYLKLSDTAALDPSERPDWARRVLAAARWLRAAEATMWPAQALAASVTALECLFVKSRGQRNKGETIANGLTTLILVQGHTEESQREWLRTQYQRRNDAVHEGATIREELEVDRLKDLTRFATRWGVWHLTPFHRAPNAPCETFDEVFDASRHSSPHG